MMLDLTPDRCVSLVQALSDGDRKTFMAYLEGGSVKAAARALFRSDRTVEKRVSSILRKLQVARFSQAVAVACKGGMI